MTDVDEDHSPPTWSIVVGIVAALALIFLLGVGCGQQLGATQWGPLAAWFHLWHNWIDVWHNLTPAQGTLLGGLAVLLAGFLAFGTGFLDRWRQQRLFHYDEVKRAYRDALALTYGLGALHRVDEDLRGQLLDRTNEKIDAALAELALTVGSDSRDLVNKFMVQEQRKALLELGVHAPPGPWGEHDPIEEDFLIEHARRDMARYLLPWSRHARSLRNKIPPTR